MLENAESKVDKKYGNSIALQRYNNSSRNAELYYFHSHYVELFTVSFSPHL